MRPDLDRRDLVHDAVLVCWKAQSRFDGREAIGTFHYLRARGAMIDSLRRHENRRAGRHDIQMVPIGDYVDDEGQWLRSTASHYAVIRQAFEADRRETMADLINRLPARERFVIVEHYVEGRQLRELGPELGVHASRISQLHHRALRRLKEALQPHSKTGSKMDRHVTTHEEIEQEAFRCPPA
jgi:RNA polymerase sigma factor (sigma-70 family)